MIPIDRGAEPPELHEVRERRLPRAIDAFNEHGPGSKELLDILNGYDVVKRVLFERQHKKCAYCERQPGFDGQPVEHFRPKKLAIRGRELARVVDRERYWWLTWTWSNLFFACGTCNGPARKGNRFPLAVGSQPLGAPLRPAPSPLPAQSFVTSGERPLLLDPSDRSIDPLDHLRWLPVDRTLARSAWTWELRAKTAHGRATKQHLRLDDLADEVASRYRETVWPRFHRDVERRLASTTPDQLLAAWDKLVRDLVQPASPLTAATWSMLDVLRVSTEALRRARLLTPPRP